MADIFRLFYYDQIETIAAILPITTYCISIVVSPVFNIILISLAVQRFLLYFYEDSERFLNLKSIYWSFLVVFLYLSFAILHISVYIKEYSFEKFKFEFEKFFASSTDAIKNSLLFYFLFFTQPKRLVYFLLKKKKIECPMLFAFFNIFFDFLN